MLSWLRRMLSGQRHATEDMVNTSIPQPTPAPDMCETVAPDPTKNGSDPSVRMPQPTFAPDMFETLVPDPTMDYADGNVKIESSHFSLVLPGQWTDRSDAVEYQFHSADNTQHVFITATLSRQKLNDLQLMSLAGDIVLARIANTKVATANRANFSDPDNRYSNCVYAMSMAGSCDEPRLLSYLAVFGSRNLILAVSYDSCSTDELLPDFKKRMKDIFGAMKLQRQE
jgi:hypothetical protein